MVEIEIPSGTRLLVTGASGLVGKKLLNYLSGKAEVFALSRDPEKRAPQERDLAHWIKGDLLEPLTFMHELERIDVVVNLAQSPKYREFPDAAADIFGVNTAGSVALLDAAARMDVRKFIHVSTGGVYAPQSGPIPETAEFNPGRGLQFYASTKYAAELMVSSYGEMFETAILRPFFVYGVGQQRSMLIPSLIEKIGTGQSIYLHGHSGLSLNPVCVDDFVACVIAAVQSDVTGTFNVAGPETKTIRELCETVGGILGQTPVFDVLDVDVVPDMVADTSRQAAELVKPCVPFSVGVRPMCEHWSADTRYG